MPARRRPRAALSALVIKGSWFLIVRLWFSAMPAVATAGSMQLLGALGAAAIVFGSVAALRQQRLKLLVAFSTVAQIGYLFLMFPLAFDPSSLKLSSSGALTGGMLQAIAHATAKAAMFMSAGLIYTAMGHDRIQQLCGVVRVLPISVLAFAVAGLVLIGVPPGGAYLAKELLLGAADQTGQWWWALVLQSGAFLTGSYVVLVLAHALARSKQAVTAAVRVSRLSEAVALALAVCSLLLGLFSWGALFSVPTQPWNELALKTLSSALWPILGGVVVLMMLLAGDLAPHVKVLGAMLGPARRVGFALSGLIEEIDSQLRQWAVACFSFVLLALLFGLILTVKR